MVGVDDIIEVGIRFGGFPLVNMERVREVFSDGNIKIDSLIHFYNSKGEEQFRVFVEQHLEDKTLVDDIIVLIQTHNKYF